MSIASRGWKRQEGPCPGAFRAAWHCQHLVFGFLAFQNVRVHFCGFKPLSLWAFVTAAAGSSHGSLQTCKLQGKELMNLPRGNEEFLLKEDSTSSISNQGIDQEKFIPRLKLARGKPLEMTALQIPRKSPRKSSESRMRSETDVQMSPKSLKRYSSSLVMGAFKLGDNALHTSESVMTASLLERQARSWRSGASLGWRTSGGLGGGGPAPRGSGQQWSQAWPGGRKPGRGD